MKTALLFPGQGSQRKGMGADLFDAFPEFSAQASRSLGYDVRELCLSDPNGELSLTRFTQPALFVVNALTWFRHAQEDGPPHFVAGHSLGEYNALLAAEAFDFGTGIRLVKERGALMSRAAGGGMAAVLNLSPERIATVLREEGLSSIDLANFNAPSQTAISGPKEDVERAVGPLQKAGGRCLVLNVSAAFHSRYMASSSREFAAFLEAFEFQEPTIPVIANVTGRPYAPHEIKDNLSAQIDRAVRWTDSMRYLLANGVGEVREMGPGAVLTNLFNAIREQQPPIVAREDATAAPPVVERVVATSAPTPAARAAPPAAIACAITADRLGSAAFRQDYGLRYAYVSGAMYKGIASPELVVRMGNAGLMGYYGTGGLTLEEIEDGIRYIQRQQEPHAAYGLNLLNSLDDPKLEMDTVGLYLRYGVRNVEAAAYLLMTEPLVLFRLKGACRDGSGRAFARNRVMSKVSRPEVAEAFMSPAPAKLVARLVEQGKLSREEAAVGLELPVSQDVCVEADSGGHTDGGVAYALMPAMLRLRDRMQAQYGYADPIRIGAAGGIGAPESVAAAFVMGADFVLTGSVNQCSPEAGTSDLVKDMLQGMNVQDTDYAPAGDMFEMGAKVQVLRRGVFFPVRAQKLYELYRQYDSLEAIDEKTRRTIQEKYFRRSFETVWEETRAYWLEKSPRELEKAERNPKHKMAMLFKWYFVHTNRIALSGDREQKVDFQVHCGPALGAFNQFVLGTELEDWRKRHVDIIAEKLMQGAADVLNQRFRQMTG